MLKERVSEVDELLAAIRVVAAGGSVIDPKVVESLVSVRLAEPGRRLRVATEEPTE